VKEKKGRPANNRKYSDAEKIEALEAVNLHGGNVQHAAKAMDIPERTLREWTTGRCVTDEIFAAFASKKAGRMTSTLRALQSRLAEALFDEGKIDSAQYKELVMGFGVVTDKLRLMDGQPTQITEARIEGDLKEEAKRLLAEYKDLLGDDLKALEFLKKDAPTLASALIQ
jgi:transposase-like protein